MLPLHIHIPQHKARNSVSTGTDDGTPKAAEFGNTVKLNIKYAFQSGPSPATHTGSCLIVAGGVVISPLWLLLCSQLSKRLNIMSQGTQQISVLNDTAFLHVVLTMLGNGYNFY